MDVGAAAVAAIGFGALLYIIISLAVVELTARRKP